MIRTSILALLIAFPARSDTMQFEGKDAETLFQRIPKPSRSEADTVEMAVFCRTGAAKTHPQKYGCTMTNAHTIQFTNVPNGGETAFQQYADEIFRILTSAGVKAKEGANPPFLEIQSVKCSRKVEDANHKYRCLITE